MRLFFALPFQEEVKALVAGVQERMRQGGARGSFTRRENMHLTVAFLGEVPPKRLVAIQTAMQAAAFLSTELCFDRVGRFCRDGGDLWWLGAAHNEALLHLWHTLWGALEQAGFVPDGRRFTPHLTIARRVTGACLDERVLLPQPFSARVDTLCLMQSERIQGVLTYTELYTRRAEEAC